MTQELKDAIRVIAEYDNVVLREDDSFWNDKDEYGHWMNIKHLPYLTSSDALLLVWRKVSEQVNDELNKGGEIIKWKVRTDMLIGSILLDIGFNLLETACLKLAEIISQLNEQK